MTDMAAVVTGPDGLSPISDAQANAIAEALKTLRAAGGAIREIFGTAPEDLVALLGGSWLKVKRAENLIRTIAKAHERLKEDGIKVEPTSLSIGLPILEAAADESREELQDIWARLLASAADPARAKLFRVAFIESAKKMDPADALVLNGMRAEGGNLTNEARNKVAVTLHLSRDQIDISIDNLHKLGVLSISPAAAFLTPFGREFSRNLYSGS